MTVTTLDFCFDRMEYFASVLINPTPEWAGLCLPVLTHTVWLVEVVRAFICT